MGFQALTKSERDFRSTLGCIDEYNRFWPLVQPIPFFSGGSIELMCAHCTTKMAFVCSCICTCICVHVCICICIFNCISIFIVLLIGLDWVGVHQWWHYQAPIWLSAGCWMHLACLYSVHGSALYWSHHGDPSNIAGCWMHLACSHIVLIPEKEAHSNVMSGARIFQGLHISLSDLQSWLLCQEVKRAHNASCNKASFQLAWLYRVHQCLMF